MPYFNIVAENDESTVVAEYEPAFIKSDGYQSEEKLEAEFIKLLCGQGYAYVGIDSEVAFISNLRKQLEKLNGYDFSDSEWERFFQTSIANRNEGIAEKAKKLQEDYIQTLVRDDGSPKNIALIDKEYIHRNYLQVMNQYVEENGSHNTRYDVTILVNGLPLVHIELKRRGVAIQEAFNQINRYQRDSFWAGAALFEYVQIFVISNGTDTKYYSNTTRERAGRENTGKRNTKKTSNSFAFTSYWADANNKVIHDLVDFTRTFFLKHTLLNILTRYMVFTSEGALLVMRPYQIAATERIINRIEISSNYKKTGRIEAGGYIWHTTGSGKTLTSFKTAQLASRLPYIDKVLFVVDRKDLDYQTMKEYDRYEKGSADGNSSTAVLERQLDNRDEKGNFHDYRIIITTIQKLGSFVSKYPRHSVYLKHIVIIFDECHRSQFGELHRKITRAFRNYHIFGFTGTPIFSANAVRGNNSVPLTTEQTFGDQLHSYTIVNAINDQTVLPFRIDYINTMKEKEEIADENIRSIDYEKVLLDSERIRKVVEYTLQHYDQKTKRSMSCRINGVQKMGFNSIFACDSIPAAMKYYDEFKRQINEQNRGLRIATIYSYSPNDEDPDEGTTEGLDDTSRDFLDKAIDDYNHFFHTEFDTSSAKFQNYYKDVSMRMKNRELDILIVVNMFLTGFDATTLNTLWVDKNLKMHGLIQAFSRTNRILNSIKTFGNIVCFRNLQNETDEALALFGDKNAGGIAILRSFDDYYNGFRDENGLYHQGYVDVTGALTSQYPLPIIAFRGEQDEKSFIRLFGHLLRLMNILTAFDQFEDSWQLSPQDEQNYRGAYVGLIRKYRNRMDGDREDISDDIVFEVELVKQIEVNIDYILSLVQKYHDSNCEDKEILASIKSAIDSSIELRSKKELIENFIGRMNVDADIHENWRNYVTEEERKQLDQLIAEENLNPEKTVRFINNAFRDGELQISGTAINDIMPRMSRFGGSNREERKAGIIEKLKAFFERFSGLGIFGHSEE